MVEALGLEAGDGAPLDEREGLYRLELSALQVPEVLGSRAERGRGYARCVAASRLLAARAAGVTTAILFTGS